MFFLCKAVDVEVHLTIGLTGVHLGLTIPLNGMEWFLGREIRLRQNRELGSMSVS